MKQLVKIITGGNLIKKWWTTRLKAQTTGGIRNLFYKYKYLRISKKLGGGYVPLSTKIEECPNFPHGLSGVFVSSGALIGSNCTIFHQVTIGSNTLKDSKGYGAPIIGNDVYIGAGAKIIGNVHIGNNCRIGANAVVTENIPDNSTVVLGQMRVIARDKTMDNHYDSFKK